MKKLKLAISLLLILATSFVLKAQCWTPPDCQDQVTVSGTLGNENYKQSTCFDGSGTILNSVNFNKWEYLSFSGSLIVNQIINMNKGSHVYANGAIHFDKINFSGGDTVFANGAIVIDKAISNNSNKNSENFIVITKSTSLLIEGTSYTGGGVIKGNGNNSNDIKVIFCEDISLPVKLEYWRISGHVIGWKVPDQTNVQSYSLEGSYDAVQWTPIISMDVNNSGAYIYDATKRKYSGVGILMGVLLILLGMSVAGKRVKVAGIALVLVMASVSSCSKEKEVVKPESYNAYRLSINMYDGTHIYSPVLWDKK